MRPFLYCGMLAALPCELSLYTPQCPEAQQEWKQDKERSRLHTGMFECVGSVSNANPSSTEGATLQFTRDRRLTCSRSRCRSKGVLFSQFFLLDWTDHPEADPPMPRCASMVLVHGCCVRVCSMNASTYGPHGFSTGQEASKNSFGQSEFQLIGKPVSSAFQLC